jgi:cation transport regulator ChaC
MYLAETLGALRSVGLRDRALERLQRMVVGQASRAGR